MGADNYSPPWFSVAPMMEWTDAHYRKMARIISKHAWLYTEMIAAETIVYQKDNLLPGLPMLPGMIDGLGPQLLQRRQLYAAPMSKLRLLMICRMAKPEEVLIVEDENGNIVRETLKDNDVLVQYKDQIKEINEKRKSEQGSSSNIKNDAVTEVLGSDKKGRVRGMGSHVTQSQVGHLHIAQAKEVLLKQERDRFEEMKDDDTFASYASGGYLVRYESWLTYL